MVPRRPPPSPAVLTNARPSPTVPGRPHPSPAVLNSPRPSSHIPGCPSPLPCTNMSHPVGPAVLPLGRTGRTTASRPVPSGALGSPPAGPRRAPGRLRTLELSLLCFLFSLSHVVSYLKVQYHPAVYVVAAILPSASVVWLRIRLRSHPEAQLMRSLDF